MEKIRGDREWQSRKNESGEKCVKQSRERKNREKVSQEQESFVSCIYKTKWWSLVKRRNREKGKLCNKERTKLETERECEIE